MITNNWFDSIGNFDFGYGVSLRTSFYADVTNNLMTRVWTGVHTNDFHVAGGPATWNISGNNIQSYAGGILYWLEYGGATSATINNNQISAATGAVANNFGVLMVTVQNTVSPTFTNNTITGTDYGIGLFNVSTSNSITLGSTNAVVGTKLAGVLDTDNLNFNPVNTTNFLAGGPGAASTVIVSGMPITSAAGGIGIKVDASGGTATNLTLTGATAISNGATGLLLSGALAAVTGNTIDSTTFTGQTGNYITLAGGAEAGNTVDATLATFDGLGGSVGITTLSQFYGIEDKVTDYLDDAAQGYVKLKTGHDYVTQASETASNGALQRGINVAVANDSVHVQAGTFQENLSINKALTLLGANAGVAGSATRGAESRIITSGNQTSVVTLTSGNVTIDGFVIDGDDPAVTGATLASGDDANVSYGIRAAASYSNLTIQNNILKHEFIGFRGDANNTATTGNVITNNWFDSIGNFDFGYGVSLRTSFYADVTNNLMTRVWTGVHTNDFHVAGGPATWNISGNNIQSYAGGILYWLEYGSATSATINNNQISAATGAVANNFGVLMVTVQNTVSPTFTNNTITGTDYGIGLFNVSTSNSITLGATNAVVGTKVAGVLDTDNLNFNPVNTTNFLAGGPGAASTVIISGMPITSAAGGIGIKVDASGGTATNLTLTGATAISNGTTGLLLSGALAAVTGNTIDSTTFTGQTGNYITLAGGAEAGNTVDATLATFDGLGGSVGTTTLSQFYGIEDKVTDYLDDAAQGYVKLKTGHDYVTQASETASNGALQRGINVAVANDSVHVQAGTFQENPNVNKPLTLLGANAGIAGSGVRGGETVLLTSGNASAVVTLTSSNVTIDGFTINGDDPAVTGAALGDGDDSNVSYGIRPTSNYGSETVQNNIIEKTFVGFRGDGVASGSLITKNWFDSIGNFDFGYGVSLRADYYADVTNNKMTRVWSGIHLNNFSLAGGPASWNISGNNIQSYAGGILYWLEYGGATSATINNNQISAATGAVANNFGVLMVTIQNTVSPTFTNNTITGTDYGIGLTNTSTTNAITLGATNAIVNAKLAGVYLTDNLTFNPVNTTPLTSNAYTAAGDVIGVTVSGMSITSTTGVGVKVETSRTSAVDVATTATINNNTTITTGGPAGTGTGVLVKGALARAQVSGNIASIHDNLIGIDVNGGSATVASNHIFNNGTGIAVENGGTLVATNNFITANTGQAVLVANTGTPVVTVHDNDLSGNATPAVKNNNSGMTVDAAENYWGSSALTLAAVAGQVSGNVNFEPILTSGDANLVTPGFQPNLSSLLVDVSTPNASPTEGGSFTLNLVPANPTSNNATLTQWDINWGDSQHTIVSSPSIPASVTHTYAEEGSFTIIATATDELSNTAATTLGVNVLDAALASTQANLTPPVAVEGQPFTNVTVFHFTDNDPAGVATDYTALVTLGDGNTVTLTGVASANGQIVANGGGFDVQLSYTYAEFFNNHTFSVSVVDHGAPVSASVNNFSVADAALTDTSAPAIIQVPVGVSTGTVTVATFTDANPGNHATDFSANIHWGDGNTTPGTVSFSGGVYSVRGTHTYSTNNYDLITADVADIGGQTLTGIGKTAALVVLTPPSFTSGIPTSTVAAGQAYSFTFSAAGLPTPTLSASNLPAWLSFAPGTGVLSGTTTVAGVYSNIQVTATNSQGSATQTFNITVTAAGVDHFAFIISPTTATAGVGFPLLTIAQDQYNNPIPGYTGTLHFTSTDPQAPSPAADSTFISGNNIAVATLKTATATGWTITATDTVNHKTGTTGSILVTAGAASSLLISTPPTALTGSPFTVTATAKDMFGNIATGYTGTVKLTSTDNAATFSASPYTFTTGAGSDNGVHTFVNGATLNTAGNQTVTVTDINAVNPLLTATSSAIAARGLLVSSITTSPTGFTITFNKPINPATLALYNSNNSTVNDVTLKAPLPVGAIHGSLLVDPTNTSVTFKTTSQYLLLKNNFQSVVLPDATYTVTLVSGSGTNGFLDALVPAWMGPTTAVTPTLSLPSRHTSRAMPPPCSAFPTSLVAPTRAPRFRCPMAARSTVAQREFRSRFTMPRTLPMSRSP